MVEVREEAGSGHAPGGRDKRARGGTIGFLHSVVFPIISFVVFPIISFVIFIFAASLYSQILLGTMCISLLMVSWSRIELVTS